MTATTLNGRAIASELRARLKLRVDLLAAGAGVVPTLRVVLVGKADAEGLYAERLTKAASTLGLSATIDHYEDSITDHDPALVIQGVNDEPALDGAVVAMPLPAHLSPAIVSNRLNPVKDVDGITVANAGRLYLGQPSHVPSTAAAIMQLLKACETEIRGKKAVVVGRSAVVGKPVGLLLLRESATVTFTHTGTQNLTGETLKADILVTAAGRAGLIRGDMIKPGAVVIDAGINSIEGGIVGDVAFEEAKEVAGAISPVPGGVGPLTNAMVLRQVIENAERRVQRA